MTRLAGFLAGRFGVRFAGDFVLRTAGTFFLGVRVLVLRGLGFDRVFFRDFKAPLMPAWATNNVFLMFLKSFSSVSTAMASSCQNGAACASPQHKKTGRAGVASQWRPAYTLGGNGSA